MLTTNITDLCQMATDQELNMIRSVASNHIKWRREHRKELNEANVTGLCRCGATIHHQANPLRDRGYMIGIECDQCR